MLEDAKMMERVAGAVERRPYLVLLCVFLVSGFMTYGVTRLALVIFYAFVAALVILPSVLVIYALWKRK